MLQKKKINFKKNSYNAYFMYTTALNLLIATLEQWLSSVYRHN